MSQWIAPEDPSDPNQRQLADLLNRVIDGASQAMARQDDSANSLYFIASCNEQGAVVHSRGFGYSDGQPVSFNLDLTEFDTAVSHLWAHSLSIGQKVWQGMVLNINADGPDGQPALDTRFLYGPAADALALTDQASWRQVTELFGS